ncbi:MAG: serine/threonine protein kinase [Planctomycetes bacterium]|nr:serine/threonine protein kinase [Planctomycetota bacterium]
MASSNTWILEQFLGMGGFGEVWRATKSLYPKSRAFKFFTDPANQDWLKQEGRALAAVKEELGDHPNIIQYIDIEPDAKPFPYLALDFANGGTLEDWIMQPASEQPELDVSKLMAGIIDGLCEAHQANIFHRDIKPANILLHYEDESEQPTPLIADFGLSRADPVMSQKFASSSVSSRQLIVGTHLYLPPEASGYGGVNFAQQDVFALGVTWYQVLICQLERPPYDFPVKLKELGIDSRTVNLLSRCLAQPSRRFRTAMDLKDAFENENADTDWNVPAGCFDVGPLAKAMFGRVLTSL